MIGRRSGPKRGSFPLLGGRCMLRREMGSERGSLPPKEGDLTCMTYKRLYELPKTRLFTKNTVQSTENTHVCTENTLVLVLYAYTSAFPYQ